MKRDETSNPVRSDAVESRIQRVWQLAGSLAAGNVPLGLADVHGPALEMAERSGLLARVGTDRVFPTTPAAAAWAQSVADAPAPD
jgi:hypothetical protein